MKTSKNDFIQLTGGTTKFWNELSKIKKQEFLDSKNSSEFLNLLKKYRLENRVKTVKSAKIAFASMFDKTHKRTVININDFK